MGTNTGHRPTLRQGNSQGRFASDQYRQWQGNEVTQRQRVEKEEGTKNRDMRDMKSLKGEPLIEVGKEGSERLARKLENRRDGEVVIDCSIGSE